MQCHSPVKDSTHFEIIQELNMVVGQPRNNMQRKKLGTKFLAQ